MEEDQIFTRNDCNSSFTEHERNKLIVSWLIPSIISFVMCSTALLLVISLKLYKHFVYRLAVYQVLACLFFSAIGILMMMNINYTKDKFHVVECNIMAFLIHYAIWMNLLFTLCLVFHIFCMVVCFKNFEKLEILYILLSLLFPLVTAWIPFINHSYGVSNAWCWIRSWNENCPSERYKEGIIEQFTLWYGPLMVSLTVCVISVGIIILVLAWRACNRYKSQEKEPLIISREQNKNKKALKQVVPLLAYPIIFYVLALLPFIDRVDEAIPHSNYYLVLAHAIANALWGFFSGLALLVHVIILRKPLCQGQTKSVMEATNAAEATTAVYTVDTDASTGAKTVTVIPEESYLDSE